MEKGVLFANPSKLFLKGTNIFEHLSVELLKFTEFALKKFEMCCRDELSCYKQQVVQSLIANSAVGHFNVP